MYDRRRDHRPTTTTSIHIRTNNKFPWVKERRERKKWERSMAKAFPPTRVKRVGRNHPLRMVVYKRPITY